MDAVKFLEEYNRMCNTYNDCVGCPMHDKPFCHPHDMTTNDERKELVDTVERWGCEHSIVTNEMNDTINRTMAINAIDRAVTKEAARWSLQELPSAQPKQKKGKWIPYSLEGLRYKCSECESKYETPWHFCPNCGSYNGGGQSD